MAGLGIALGAVGAGLAIWDAGYEARVLPGVHVAGVDLSGLDRAGASSALEAALPYGAGRLVLRAPSGDVAIPYSVFRRRANVDALVGAALRAGRAGDVAARLPGQLGMAVRGVTIAPGVHLDPEALAAAVSAALAPLAVAPVDATISMGASGAVTTRAREGAAVDAGRVAAAALAALRDAAAPAEVVVPVDVTPVDPVVSDLAVQVAAFQASVLIGDGSVTLGKQAWTLNAATVRSWVGFSVAADGSVRPTVDTSRIPAALAQVAGKVSQPARPAVFLRDRSGRVVGVAASSDGRSLDAAATSQRIADALLARVATGAAVSVQVATAPVPPALTTEQAAARAPVLTLLGTWTTWFPVDDHNYYGANIWIPAQVINGTVLGPGQTFEWWAAVGDVSPAQGYGPGGVIAGDHTDPTGALGGGMCSSSTTLFNAALRAGLSIGARGNHRYYIDRYPLGLDATVWKMRGSVQDMSFTNDTGSPILILGLRTRSGGTGYVTYQLWGVPDGRTVSISAPVVSNVVRATTSVRSVTTLRPGVRRQTEYPSNQMDVSVSRVVRDRDGRLIHADAWRSSYVLWNGVIEIGL
ncbi:MAG: VanW family protein [Thermoleophilia bacterium]|nr:VanW family protein [Thermoleophilia bacterium]